MPHRLDSERARLHRAASGSRPDFDRLFDAYFPRVYAFALRRLGERRAAEQVTGQVLQDLIEALPHWRRARVSGWLFERTLHAIDGRRS